MLLCGFRCLFHLSKTPEIESGFGPASAGLFFAPDLFIRTSWSGHLHFDGNTCRIERKLNQCSFRYSSRKRPFSDSISAFWFGLPGSMRNSWTPRACAYDSSVRLQNFFPLLVLIALSSPRVLANWSRMCTSCTPPIARSETMATVS